MFYDKFKALCDERGISCRKAAEDMGLHNSTPSKWKKEGSTPKVETLEKVSAYFNVTLDELLSDKEGELNMEIMHSLCIAGLIQDVKGLKILSICTAVALLIFMAAVVFGGLL